MQSKCSMLPATPDDACQTESSMHKQVMRRTHQVAISNQARQRNDCYKHSCVGLLVLKQRNGKGWVKMAKKELK